MGHPVRISGDEIASALRAGSREPFREILETFLRAAPDADAIAEFAQRSPDRYAQALSMLGKLSGFTEKFQLNHSMEKSIAQMGDAELKVELQKALDKRDALLAEPTLKVVGETGEI